MPKIAVESVRVTEENGAQLIIQAGEPIPAWAEGQVTNPAAYVEASKSAAVEGEGVDYESMTLAELKKEVASRNEQGADLPTEGKKAELVEALTADDNGV